MLRRHLGAIGLVLLFAALGLAQEVGQPAPDVEITEWYNGTGENSLGEFRGRVILLEIWATW